MKIKTSELIGPALDWAVGQCAYENKAILEDGFVYHTSDSGHRTARCTPSTNWNQGGPIIDEKGITIIRLDDRNIPDAKGFWTRNYEPQWGASAGGGHSTREVYGSQGDFYGEWYQVDEDAMVGPTALVAAMRCYVASELGDEVELPDELINCNTQP